MRGINTRIIDETDLKHTKYKRNNVLYAYTLLIRLREWRRLRGVIREKSERM